MKAIIAALLFMAVCIVLQYADVYFVSRNVYGLMTLGAFIVAGGFFAIVARRVIANVERDTYRD